MELNNTLKNIELDENRQNKILTGQETPYPGHAQKNATMCPAEAATEADASPTPQDTFQTTESQYPLHSPDISRAIENVLNDLTIVIMAWPRLPDSVRKSVIAIVQSAPTQTTT